jgi:apolipoprotein D and lipocalin family protein
MKTLTVVPAVDLSRYLGTWYEIARLPNKYQNDCACNVKATYSVGDDGGIKVVNRCIKANGDTISVEGRARRASQDEPNTKLKVRFAPAFLSFLPFVWGDYWIIDLAPDYSCALIGEPNRKNLWVLGRTPTLPDGTVRRLLDRAVAEGYDISALIMTKQTE